MQGKEEKEDVENKEEEEELEEGDKKDKNLRWREVTRSTTKQRERRDQSSHARFPGPWRRHVLITQRPPDQAEGQGEADKGPVPLMVLPHSGHAHEDEDQGLADAA